VYENALLFNFLLNIKHEASQLTVVFFFFGGGAEVLQLSITPALNHANYFTWRMTVD